MEYLVGSAVLWLMFGLWYGLPVIFAAFAGVMIYRRWRTHRRL